MAKYDVEYSCGHSGRKNLYGPHRERRRHLEWAAREGLCPECYQACMREQEAQATPKFYLRIIPSVYMAEFVAYYGSYQIKEELKARRAGSRDRWRYISIHEEDAIYEPGGMLDLLDARPVPGWRLRLPVFSDEEKAEVIRELKWICRQGWKLEIESDLVRILAAVVEGRRELAQI